MKQLWITKLPGEAGIFNDGLIGLPVYNDHILFHSTIFTNQTDEDNRLHALNVETGKINWTFPENYDNENSMFFWGRPYLNQNRVIVKMPAFGNFCSRDRIMCLDAGTGHMIWKTFFPENQSVFTSRNVCGSGNRFWFFQQSENEGFIYEGNCENGDTVRLCTLKHENPAFNIHITSYNYVLINIEGKNKLVFSMYEYNKSDRDNFSNYLLIFDIETRNIETKILIEGDSYYSINNIIARGNTVFLTQGRTVISFDAEKKIINWTHQFTDVADLATTEMLNENNILFLWGHNRFQALNTETGNLLYTNPLQCANADVFDGVVYIIGRDGELHMVDIYNGNILMNIESPETKITDRHFLFGCKPQVHGDKLFVFTMYHAVCFQAYKK